MSPAQPGGQAALRLAGVVLAGGASSRMGTPKALLRVRGETFLDRLSHALAAGGCEPVLAVAGGAADAIRAGCVLDFARLLTNPEPERGQISSLWCALDAVPEADGLVCVLVDQGGIEPDTVRAVCKGLAAHPVAVARHAGRAGHPTGFGRSVFGLLRAPLAARSGARAVVEAEAAVGRVAWIDVVDPGVVRNLNSPEDLDLARDGLEVDRP